MGSPDIPVPTAKIHVAHSARVAIHQVPQKYYDLHTPTCIIDTRNTAPQHKSVKKVHGVIHLGYNRFAHLSHFMTVDHVLVHFMTVELGTNTSDFQWPIVPLFSVRSGSKRAIGDGQSLCYALLQK